MSNRTIVELNHDYCPKDDELQFWANEMRMYMQSGDISYLPEGILFIGTRHHSESFPLIKKELFQKILLEHWPQLICDKAKKQDVVVCSCSKINLGIHKSVEQALKSWINHILSLF